MNAASVADSFGLLDLDHALRAPAPPSPRTTPAPTGAARGRRPAAEDEDDDIIVTAQKRSENLQDVPISIQALGTEQLEELNVANFHDYTRLLPSISFQTLAARARPTSISAASPAAATATIRARCPSVGVYLDEQPVTTIGGTLDVHIYDIARIEVLRGPQGTLYGASSRGRHDPHHHQPARSVRLLRRRRRAS